MTSQSEVARPLTQQLIALCQMALQLEAKKPSTAAKENRSPR